MSISGIPIISGEFQANLLKELTIASAGTGQSMPGELALISQRLFAQISTFSSTYAEARTSLLKERELRYGFSAEDSVRLSSLISRLDELFDKEILRLQQYSSLLMKPHQASTPVLDYSTSAETLVLKLPSSEEEIKNRLGLAYQVAFGLAQLHKLGMCHANVKVNHVEVARDHSGGLFGRLVGGGSVCWQGRPMKSYTLSYLDLGSSSQVKGRIATTTEDMWAFGLFVFELIFGQRENPFLNGLGKRTVDVDAWRSSYERLKAKLSESDSSVHVFLRKILAPSSDRLTAEQAVAELRVIIGDGVIGEVYHPGEMVRSCQKILSPTTGEFFVSDLPCEERKYKDRCRIAYHAALSLRSLHERGICYMNIKPAKIEVKVDPKNLQLHGGLLDDGGLHRVGQLVGRATSQYFDYSLTKEGETPHASFEYDWWAFGLTLYEIFHGRTDNPYAKGLSEMRPQIRLLGEGFCLVSHIRRRFKEIQNIILYSVKTSL